MIDAILHPALHDAQRTVVRELDALSLACWDLEHATDVRELRGEAYVVDRQLAACRLVAVMSGVAEVVRAKVQPAQDAVDALIRECIRVLERRAAS